MNYNWHAAVILIQLHMPPINNWGEAIQKLSNCNFPILLALANYNLISQGKISSCHGGLAIYLFKKYDHKTLTVYNHSDIWEGQFVEISGVTLHKDIVIGNIYRPPRDLVNDYRNFKEQLIPIFEHSNNINLEAVIAGDMNIDLLKINERNVFNEYFDSMISHGFPPALPSLQDFPSEVPH